MSALVCCDVSASVCATGPAVDYEAEFGLYDGDSDDFGRPRGNYFTRFVIATSRADAVAQIAAYGASVGATVYGIDAWPTVERPQPWTGKRSRLTGCTAQTVTP